MVRPVEETDIWRILLFGRDGDELLLLRTPSGYRLPELRIPRCQRVAPNLNAEAKRLWNLDTVCLLPLEISNGDLAVRGTHYHVMEVCRPQELVHVAPDFVQMSRVKEDSFADLHDYVAVRQEMEPKTASLAEDHCGPFSKFGAFERISAWVAEQLQPLGVRLDGNFHQLQATASFALIRFATNRGAVWFKAVGDPNLRECSITRSLTARLPQYVPALLAEKADWNAWLVAEAQGQGLFESSDPATWCRAAESLAELQIASLPHTTELHAPCAHDVRAQKLLHRVDPFFLVMQETMQAQTKTTVPKLTEQEISSVGELVAETLHKLAEAGIPDALNHLDLNPCNVIVSTSGCTFLDWAEAAVGNPFFSLEYLRQEFLQVFPGRVDCERNFYNSYLNRWNPVLAVKNTRRLAPSCAACCDLCLRRVRPSWDDPKMCQRPELSAFLRSLVRRMHRESEQIRTSRAA